MTTKYHVVCEEHTSKPFIAESAAQAHRVRIMKGGHCPLDHYIIEETHDTARGVITYRDVDTGQVTTTRPL